MHVWNVLGRNNSGVREFVKDMVFIESSKEAFGAYDFQTGIWKAAKKDVKVWVKTFQTEGTAYVSALRCEEE